MHIKPPFKHHFSIFSAMAGAFLLEEMICPEEAEAILSSGSAG
jgi:hypothetical protein